MVKRRPARRRPRSRKRPSGGSPAARWVLLVLAGAALFAAGLYLGSGDRLSWSSFRLSSPAGPGPAKGRPRPAAPEEADRTETPPVVPTEPEKPTVTPGELPEIEGPPPPGDGATVALVIDDLGRSVADVRRIEALGVPITYAVLPYESHTRQVVAALRAKGEEMILHLPMQPENGANPGPGALTVIMSRSELAAATRRALAAVPGAVGMNNHMGSRLTADRTSMDAVLRVVGKRGLYFLDSRTTPASVAFRTARALDIPAAERQVFLDPDPRREAVRYQFRRLLSVARKEGSGIAIGHPHPETLLVLEQEVPEAVRRGYRFVPVSYLLDRSSVAAK
jgi:polysaccharide deacetylase 2 family uncharacterized protein YibQ